ncbi:AAA family ATPase [Ferrimonas pelagia]|uniref:ATPase AAA n=1 Tax=Ferrimonas pelagia TaxID=1177826 RepID=A0ABP9EJQ5_9GAMM
MNIFTREASLEQEPIVIRKPAPVTIAEIGVDPALLMQLLVKHLSDGDVLTLSELSQRLALRAVLVQQLLDEAKQTALVENRQASHTGQMRYSLSRQGRDAAQMYFATSGYLGPTPVPLAQFADQVRAQSSRQQQVTRDDFIKALEGMVIPGDLVEQLGPALNSRRPLLIYGPAGTGKSYICSRLNQIFEDDVLIPHAICVGHAIIPVFDPQLHCLMGKVAEEELNVLAADDDLRWYRCHRPALIVGGELTADMLDIQFDTKNRTYQAPIGLKATNGILLIDDLGRQSITPKQILNRWILPLEEGRDFLSLPSGEHFEVPFEQLLLFSTNLSPTELVDPAFLRRLGYKIHFGALEPHEYWEIWQQNCRTAELEEANGIREWLLNERYRLSATPMLPCHPRDLLAIVIDRIRYNQLPNLITQELLEHAWDMYFVHDDRQFTQMPDAQVSGEDK